VQATGRDGARRAGESAEHAMPLGHDLDAMAQLVNERTRLVFVANPNNPTGTWVECDALRSSSRRAGADAGRRRRGVYRIRRATPTSRTRAAGWRVPNLIVTRTFSKATARGLRVGYALSHPRWRTCSIACASRSTSTRSRSPRAGGARRHEHLKRSATESRGMAQCGGLRCARRASSAVRGNFVLIDGRPPGRYEACCARA
jgi:histidinol-phosphate aminotransferase